jgi:DNA-binding response OmpR family regulator
MKALLVDDDLVLSDILAFALRRAGFQVALAFDGPGAVEAFTAEAPDLVVLDINLPKMDGFAVCRRIRAMSTVPIIMLTVRNQEDDVIRGLELGADDYVTKPFSPRQLVARAQAVLRRAGSIPASGPIELEGLSLDQSRRQIHVPGGSSVSLTPLECRLMETFINSPDQILPSEMILQYLWGPSGGDHNMLRQVIHRLRGKLQMAGTHVRIETVAGVGYGLITGEG